jgi:hypothetical protein
MVRTFLDTGSLPDMDESPGRASASPDAGYDYVNVVGGTDPLSKLYRPPAPKRDEQHRRSVTVGSFDGQAMKVSPRAMETFREMGGTLKRRPRRQRQAPPGGSDSVT